MSEVETHWNICHDGELHVRDIKWPTAWTDVVAWGDGSKLNNTVVNMVLIVVKYHYELCKEFIDVCFGVQLLPIGEAKSCKLLEHLTLL